MKRVEPSSKLDRFYDLEGTTLLQANGGLQVTTQKSALAPNENEPAIGGPRGTLSRPSLVETYPIKLRMNTRVEHNQICLMRHNATKKEDKPYLVRLCSGCDGRRFCLEFWLDD